MKKTSLKHIILLALLTPFLSTHAKNSDLNQEITIKSDRQTGDLKNKIISYLDDVSIKQGSLSIEADLVQVLQQSNSKEQIYIAKGKPAIFSQKLEDGSPIILQANEIRYEPGNSTITIIGNAMLKQDGSEVRGSKITYNTTTEQLEAESDSNNAVTTILSPKAEKKD